MNISIIGGTGFVGQAVVDRLLADGHHLRLLVRPGSGAKAPEHPQCTRIEGRLEDPDSLRSCIAGSDAVIYLVGLLRENAAAGITFELLQFQGVERSIAAAKAAGVARFLLMSANGIDAGETPYQRTKLQAEAALKDSGLEWSIFRPSVIFGEPNGRMEFCSQLKAELIDGPVPAPLFYQGLLPLKAGQFKLGPVWVEDVAAAFATALTGADTIGQTYALCGPSEVSWKEILTTIAAASGKKKTMLPAPVMLIAPIAAVMERFQWFPVTRDQLKMLVVGNCCTEDGFSRLGIRPAPFNTAALKYLG
ncbi:NAD(P)H-binding protein [Thiorhodovibrio frisius]|uniref:Putative nucleoside-diphosphate sugar epimerase n=1 Tax=Thiorhodovibrio frisius TaxID=631362 RepID=H8Z5Y2_9GAMM|nr:NAD(P)H-binding protein [Thiorhodovibrio frisius]EIC20632.1 putative nucleoside-diphosphate sugar epimerase [Thiorhodovibrio frisius]WPL21381.1 Cholesterol dehydrogenase [Thiorhodovibrio frisius]